MIHGLVFLVKILGILLLILLLLLLAALCAALFVPIRYRIRGEFPEGGGTAWGEGKVTWLFGIFCLKGRLTRGEGLRVQTKIFGFSLGRKKKARNETEMAGDEPGMAGEDMAGDEPGTARDDMAGYEPGMAGDELQKQADAPPADSPAAEMGDEPAERGTDQGGPEGFLRRLLRFFRQIRDLLKKMYRKIKHLSFSFQAFCGKLKEIAGKAAAARSWISDEKNQDSLRLLARQGGRLASHSLPRKGHGAITFGFSDPYMTGQALAAASLIYPFCHRRLDLYPVFDRKILVGSMDFRGRIRSAYVLWLAWAIFRDKHTWRMIRGLLNRR